VKVAIFSTQDFERDFFNAANKPFRHELTYYCEGHRPDGRGLPSGLRLCH
jgi:hypothetical protein